MTTTTTETSEKIDTAVLTITETDLIPIFTADGILPLIDSIEERARSFAFDVSEEEGRDGIRSLAYNVARAKTTIDGAGKNIVAEWKEKSKRVDEARRIMRDKLGALKEEIRAPLTAWEEAEKAEVARIQAETDIIEVWDDAHRENADRDELARRRATDDLAEKLRLEAEERDRQAAREEQIRKEVLQEAEREKQEAIEAEHKRLEDEFYERLNARHERIERERKTEEAERIKAKRLANHKAHREKIHREARASLLENGIPAEIADGLILMISEGKIKHVEIKY